MGHALLPRARRSDFRFPTEAPGRPPVTPVGHGMREGTSRMRGVPEEIPDAESEQVLARVCAIDVAKESGMVCTWVPGPTGRRISRVWQVAATTNAVSDLTADLVAAGAQKVTVEST